MKISTPFFKIDSFKVRILKEHLNEITLPSNLNAEIISLYVATGEVVKSSETGTKDKSNSLKLSNDNGLTSIAIAIESIRTSAKQQEYVTLKITSKLLKQRYYEGINRETLSEVVKYLNSVGIGINFRQLLISEITDIDICKDVLIETNEYKELIAKIKLATKPSKELNKGYNLFSQKDNKGIQFSNRKTATPNNAFFKIYNKFLDTTGIKHVAFFEAYKIETETNLHRIEATLKNKKHFEKFKLNNTLETFLNLEQEQLANILNSITSIHINKQEGKEVELRKQQNIYEAYIELSLKYGAMLQIPFETTKGTLLDSIEKRTTKMNHNYMFDNVEKELKNTSISYKENRKLESLMKELCLI